MICLETNLCERPDISGISATAIDPIMVPGIEMSGITMPVTIPNKLTASESELPDFTITAGRTSDITRLMRLEPILITAMGADSENSGLMSAMFGFIFSPLMKYVAIANMLESTQAME